MKVKRIITDNLESNCYIIYNEGNSEAIVIDPGETDIKKLGTFLKDNKINVEMVLLTHEHFDHIMGCNKLKKLYNYKLICSNECALNIVDSKKNLSFYYYNENPYNNFLPDMTYENINFKLIWNGLSIIIYRTPGHSAGSVCIQIGDIFFTGDTMLKDTSTVTKLPGGNKDKLKQSILFLKSIIIGKQIYPGHGECFSIK
jgi:glyoxylase-like metal-dependent hydrolase (beta-lactamase superfamily II)